MNLLKFSGVPTLRQPSGITHQYPPFKFETVSVASVRAQLRGLKAGKAVGLDNIPAHRWPKLKLWAMIILRNSGQDANIRVCMAKNTEKFLTKMTYLASRSVCYFVLI